MISYQYRKKKKDWLKPFLLFSVVLMLLFFGSFWVGLLSSPAVLIAKPASQASQIAGGGWLNFFEFFRSRLSLVAEREKLTKENEDLKLALVVRRGLEKENDDLKRLLGLVSESTKKPLVAEVVLTPNIVSQGTIILEVGQADAKNGIKRGDLVVYNDKVLLGRVVEIREHQTKVRLVSAGDTLPVLIGEKNIPAEAKGLGSGNFSITLPKGTEIKKGDSIIAPEYGGYLLGLVDIIKKTTADPFQTILFNSPVNIFQIKWVEIYAA